MSELTYPQPVHGWTCFHCGETFTTPGSAEDHFGATPEATAACRIKAGRERGLVMELRKAESDSSEWQQRALRAEEEVESLQVQLAGYENATGCRSAHELRCAIDSMKGREITADALITAVMTKAPEVYNEVIG